MPRSRNMLPGAPPDLLIRRLSHYAPLAENERVLLRSLSEETRSLPAGHCLIAEGDKLDTARLLLGGWACRMRTFPDGRRQIFEFLLPGDMFGLCLRPQAMSLSTVITLTPAIVADASPLRDVLCETRHDYPHIAAALHITAGLDEANLLNQLIRIGRQSAYERVAHLILELRDRLAIVGLAGDDHLPVPLTQEMLADALGLSIVHLNRTLQQLRREGLIVFKSGMMRLLNVGRLTDIADFRPQDVTRAAA